MGSPDFWLRLGLFVVLITVVAVGRWVTLRLGFPDDLVAFVGGWMSAEVLWRSFPSARPV